MLVGVSALVFAAAACAAATPPAAPGATGGSSASAPQPASSTGGQAARGTPESPAASATGSTATTSAAAPAATSSAAPAPAVPGIVIDPAAKEVRVAATVCLQRGGLELFACSRGTREHESILVTRATPAQVSKALASLGLPPGRPVFTTEGGATSPPAGAVLEISVRFFKVTDEEKARVQKLIDAGAKRDDIEIARADWFTVPAWKLLRAGGAEEGLGRPFDWVYIGPTTPAGLNAADREGTVMCLSNFSEAVIDVPFESTSVNASLLYEANPAVVPPVGTPAEIIIRPTDRTIAPKKVEWVVVLKKGEKPVVEGKPMDLAELNAAAGSAPADIRTAVLKADADESFGRVMEVRDILDQALMRVSLVVITKEGPAPPPAPAAAPVDIRITADEKVRVGDKSITIDEFRTKAAELLKGAERVRLVIDAQSSPKAVAEVMLAARLAGAEIEIVHADTPKDPPAKESPPKK